MTIGNGSQLGPYEILAPIGAGGMGEVYKAKDTRLDRTVAIKVLPEHLSKDPALRERFEREARAVSSLNHPHICTLYDVGEDDGVHFLVMEYIDGETLADRLKKGALPLELAVAYAAQIADALGSAHRANVVHRDVKPGNIMLVKRGVKLLDFGLAKTHGANVTPTQDSEQPTQNKPLTDAGTILGTVQYMAPEQLEGEEVDGRADVFALGAIFFEMVTGRKAFEGGSQASLISAIMSTEPPPVSEIQSLSPPGLDRVIRKCLTKDPDERWHSAYDLTTQLEWIAQSDAGLTPPSGAKRRWLPWAGAALVALAAVFLSWGPGPPDATSAVARFEVDLDAPITSAAPAMALSSDGKYLVYRALPTQLRVRPLASLESHALAGTESAVNPFFSPDGEWVAFYALGLGQLKKVSVESGQSLVVGDLPPGFARGLTGSWSASGTILVALGSSLYRYPAEGGIPEPVLEIDAVAGTLLHPHWLPDDRHALVTLKQGAQTALHIVDVDTGEMQELVQSGSQGSYLPSGHLIYRVRSGTESALHVVRFDIERLAIQGTPIALPVQVYTVESAGGGFFAVSPGGHLAFFTTATNHDTSLLWADTEGMTTILDIVPGVFRRPSLSPDGRRIAVDSHVGGVMEHDIWIYDVQTGTRTRFTVPGHNTSPVWKPDGTGLAFASRRPPKNNIQSVYWKRVDGSAAELLVEKESPSYPVSWSPDGRNLAFVVSHRDTQEDIWVLPLGDEAAPVLVTGFREYSPTFSPDGRWLAYVSDESGREEVYVRRFPDEGPKSAVSTLGGREPMWSRDGRTLFFRSPDGAEMWSVAVDLEPTFRAAKPEQVFARPFYIDRNRQQTYDVSPDGQRFLMVEEIEGSTQNQVVIVLNWMEELKRLVPVE